MAEWKVYDSEDVPQCTHCGSYMPFARYRKGNGVNAREITDYCPWCGERMTNMPLCKDCAYGRGVCKNDGVCYACRGQDWIPKRPHRCAGEED